MRNVADQVVAVVRRECGASCQQLVERNAKSINVGTGVRRAAKSLGRQIAQCAHDISAMCQIAPFLFGESKIGDPDHTMRIEEQVGGLDVTVQYALAMRIREAL